MKTSKSTKFAYDHNGVHLDFMLNGDSEKKAFIEILEQAQKDVADSIEAK